MLATIKNPIYHEAALITSGASGRSDEPLPSGHDSRDRHSPAVDVRREVPAPCPEKDQQHYLVRCGRGIERHRSGSCLFGYVVAYISSHHQHAHNYAMTPTKSVETRVVDRSSIMPRPGREAPEH